MVRTFKSRFTYYSALKGVITVYSLMGIKVNTLRSLKVNTLRVLK